jgi:hypothetical protein
MWICSKLGFFSIVKKDGGWHVRARERGDIEALKQAIGLRVPIEEWPDADYRWRLNVGKIGLRRIYQAFEDSVDYPNFKSEIGASPSQRFKLSIYGGFWADMQRFQEAGGKLSWA